MTPISRPSGRLPAQMRPVTIQRGFTRHAEGSVLVAFGETRVLCTASVEERVPPFLRGKGEGWVTAEYGMLPRSTHSRMGREAAQGKQGGRTLEIQRLIGRSLRACIDRAALGERTITLDCDVLQADGGTRTAAITGAYVALVDAVSTLKTTRRPILGAVAAVSVGLYRGMPVLDLDYAEDSDCDTDMNVVMNDGGGFIEVQGTPRATPSAATRWTRCSAWPSRASPSWWPRSAPRWRLERHGPPCPAGAARMKIVLASGNRGKLAELGGLLAGSGIELLPQGALGIADAVEDGRSFVENALIKARHAARLSGLPALADDSGLIVDALGGAPGLVSAHYAGVHGDAAGNIARLLAELRGVPVERRTARFYCCLVLLRHADDPQPLIAEGLWPGRILDAPRGTGGFGYDPVFFDPETGLGAGEMLPERKNPISHRGRALAVLKARLGEWIARA